MMVRAQLLASTADRHVLGFASTRDARHQLASRMIRLRIVLAGMRPSAIMAHVSASVSRNPLHRPVASPAGTGATGAAGGGVPAASPLSHAG